MKGGESRLWQRMRTGIADKCFVQRVENLVGEGVPDVWLCSKITGEGAWIELKARTIAPVRANTPIFTGSHGLRAEQVAWIYGRASVGATIFILAQCDDELWLIRGSDARELSTYSREMLNQRCAWMGSARRTDWEELVFVIFGESNG